MLTLRKEKSQINNLTLHHKELEKEEEKKARDIERKKVTEIRVEINERD